MLNVQIQAPFQVSAPLEQMIKEKINKLFTFFDRITAAEVFLKLAENDRQHIAEIRLHVPGQVLFAEEKSDRMERSFAAASNKLRKQLIRYKEQLASH